MKKLLVIGMVLAFASSMFALESDPSEVVGYVTYGCVTTDGTDLNFIALPMNSGYTMASELGNAIGVCDVVNVWDPAGQGWLSASNLGMFWAGDFAIEIGMPLMVNVTEAVSWPVGRNVNTSASSVRK